MKCRLRHDVKPRRANWTTLHPPLRGPASPHYTGSRIGRPSHLLTRCSTTPPLRHGATHAATTAMQIGLELTRRGSPTSPKNAATNGIGCHHRSLASQRQVLPFKGRPGCARRSRPASSSPNQDPSSSPESADTVHAKTQSLRDGIGLSVPRRFSTNAIRSIKGIHKPPLPVGTG